MSLKVNMYIIAYFIFSGIWLTQKKKKEKEKKIELWEMQIWSSKAAGKYDNVEILEIAWVFLCSFKIMVSGMFVLKMYF